MKITVYHNDFETNSSFTRVAVVNVPEEISAFGTTNECLEYAYRYTNNVMGSWSMKIGGDANDNVEVTAPLHISKRTGEEMGLRSSMMGDRFYVQGEEAYEVAMCGFEVIPTLEDVA